jgi:hypothetical protein
MLIRQQARYFAYEPGQGAGRREETDPMRGYMENYRDHELAKPSIDKQTR